MTAASKGNVEAMYCLGSVYDDFKAGIEIYDEEKALYWYDITVHDILASKLIGVWHSHTMGDAMFSLQDRESNRLLVEQMGEILSVIVIKWKENSIRVILYYITKSNTEILSDLYLC